jgi:hypothetical protein
MSQPPRTALAAPLVVAAVLRMVLWAAVLLRTGPAALAGGDTASYLEPGRNLLLHGVFRTAGLPEIGRPPGYPLFLALTSVAGLELAALLQVALSVLNVWLVARLARSAGLSERGVRCAAWLMALEPVACIYSVRLLSETLFCAVLLASMERMACFLRSRSLQTLAGSGVSLAAAVLVRPAAYYLPGVWAVGLFFWGWRSRSLHRLQKLPLSLQQGLGATMLDLPIESRRRLTWKAPAVLLLATLPLLAAWQLRNWFETGFGGFSSIAIRNAYFYSAAEAQAQADGVSFAQQQRVFGYPDEAAYLRSHPEQAGWSEAARLRFLQSEGRRILAAHWESAVRTQLEGSAVVAFSPCAAELLEMLGYNTTPAPARVPARVVDQGPLRAAVSILHSDPLRATVMALFEAGLLGYYLLAARGAMRVRLSGAVKALLIGTALYFLVISGGVQAVARFRMPVMPLVCVLAGAGLASRGQQTPIEIA